jgi:glucose/arabinose dehydrogenase
VLKRTLPFALSIGLAAGLTTTGISIVLAPEAILPDRMSSTNAEKAEEEMMPTMHDESLSLERLVSGLRNPTSMAFLDTENILVLQKNDGQVRLVSDGRLYEKPVLQVDVGSKEEQGLLGIAVWNGTSIDNNEGFLYLTENIREYDNTVVAINTIYKYHYDWNQKFLTHGTVVLRLYAGPGPFHNGGKITIGPDGYLYAVIGDTNDSSGVTANEDRGRTPDDRSVIVRVDRETGQPPSDNPFYSMKGLSKVYSYGIRNSFGLDFDPVSNRLWMTENGPATYDEINVVEPGFNSGWDKLTGPIAKSNVTVNDLVILGGAKYADPVFSWYIPIGVTDIEFFNSEKLGEKYKENILVGDINNGNLYFFIVDQNRTGLYFSGQQIELADLVADQVMNNATGRPNAELSSILLGEKFGRITDIETGPDGYPYVLTYMDGNIYRITANRE